MLAAARPLDPPPASSLFSTNERTRGQRRGLPISANTVILTKPPVARPAHFAGAVAAAVVTSTFVAVRTSPARVYVTVAVAAALIAAANVNALPSSVIVVFSSVPNVSGRAARSSTKLFAVASTDLIVPDLVCSASAARASWHTRPAGRTQQCELHEP